jgi:hypothetical protein
MCEWGDTVLLVVPIPASCSHTGEFRWALKPIDRCIAPLVSALNSAGLYTGGACCGHGKSNGCISMHDGTVLTITKVDPATMPCAQENKR